MVVVIYRKEAAMNDKLIARQIIKAQICSDSGKDITSRLSECIGSNKPEKQAYGGKVKYINAAIQNILKSKNSMFRFSVYQTEDQNGYDSILVYFWFKLEGEKYQISFHNPVYFNNPLLKYATKNKLSQKWDGYYGGSRYSCIKLMNLFDLYKEVRS
jgi:hypothetical protein